VTSVEELFTSVTEQLLGRHSKVQSGKIFHSVGLKSGERFFAFVRRGELVVKLSQPRVTELVTSGNGWPFDAGKGRVMKEWVVLRPIDRSSCENAVLEAMNFMDPDK
jgi:hypothetical protein